MAAVAAAHENRLEHCSERPAERSQVLGEGHHAKQISTRHRRHRRRPAHIQCTILKFSARSNIP